MDYTIIASLLIAAFIVAAAIYFRGRSTQRSSEIEKRLEDLNRFTLQQFNALSQQLDRRLKENIDILQRSSSDMNRRLDHTARIINSVTSSLSQLSEFSKRIFEVGRDISSLQDILKAPKLRGGFGEYLLGDLLAQILPRKHFKLQYRFSDGEIVDAVIFLKDVFIPVDSKFPLENFKHYLKEQGNESLRRKFKADIKKHIKSISQKYIRPDEGSADFALMYIPAENVYYEAVIKQSGEEGLDEFAFKNKVIPVSPNSFYAYLQAILLGLGGLQIEEGAREILKRLMKLKNDFLKFGASFDKLGAHLRHASGSYENSAKQLSRISVNLEQLSGGEPDRLAEPPLDRRASKS